MVAALHARGHPPEKITLLASARSEGQELEYGGETLSVEPASADSFRGMDLALFATPADVSRQLTSPAEAAGCWSVDVSPAHRLDPRAPLVLPAVNLDILKTPFRGRIVTCPSPITTALVSVLDPLQRKFGVAQVFATALMGVSAQGARGIAELERQTMSLLSGTDWRSEVFPHRIAFNLIPQLGEIAGEDASSSEELAWGREAARVAPWIVEGQTIAGNAIQVPMFFGHLVSLEISLRARVGAPEVRAELQTSRYLKVLDLPGERVYPMPMLVVSDPAVHVGRIRSLPGDGSRFAMVAAIDNARSAAENALETAEALPRRAS
jgi:aspartate-semialdehyde dehydrogenase